MDTSRYGSDPGGLWAAAEDDGNPTKTLRDQRAWKRAVEADFPSDGDVMCDPRTFMPLDQWTDVTLGVSAPPLISQRRRSRVRPGACPWSPSTAGSF